MPSIADIDRLFLLWINQPAGRNGVLDQLVYDITDAQLLKGGLFLAAYWWLWFERKGEQRRDVVVAMVAGILTAVLSRLLQVALPFHQRPLHSPGIGIHMPLTVDPETLNTFSSFPSDHAMLFFALAVPLWNRSRWLGAAAMLWTLLVICLPRVYLGYAASASRRHAPRQDADRLTKKGCDSRPHEPNIPQRRRLHGLNT